MIPLRCWTMLVFIAAARSSKILVVIPFSAKSHYHSTREVGLELARRGHEVHVITTHVEKHHPASYHQIVVECKSFWDLFGGPPMNVFDTRKLSFAEYIQMTYEGGIRHTEMTLNSSQVKKFMAEDHKFDVVINELFLQDALYMFAHQYNAPLVLMSTVGNSFRTNYFTRNPPQLSTVIHEYGRVAEPGSFYGRLKNLYFCLYDMLRLKISYLPKQEELVRKYFKNLPQPVPSLEDVTANTSLILINSHFSADGAASYLPNAIEVGGLHLKETFEKLPEDLQEFLDSSTEGAVLVSFGSNVKSSDLTEDKRDAFLKVFKRLKQNVLWKWEKDELPGKSDNIEIRTWLPQKEILAHPNLKVFITHGGLISLQEALFHGVPILGIPIFGDQFNNLLQAKNDGFAEILEYDEITEKSIDMFLSRMLNDEKYETKAKEMSRRFRDRPMPALDTAIYWIEYVIRHKGPSHMKSPGLSMNLLAFYMVDIEIMFVLTLISFTLFTYTLLNYIRSSRKIVKEKQN